MKQEFDVVETRPTYYLIFRKVDKNIGEFRFIVEREEIAIDFCYYNKNYYYLSSYDLDTSDTEKLINDGLLTDKPQF